AFSRCSSRQTVRQDGCSDFFVPNVFSPNGDGKNDFFQIYLRDDNVKILSCRLFNRWGNMIYISENNNLFRWNGRYKDKSLEAGVYVYSIEYQTIGDETIKIAKGDLTLIR
ncbi:MAG TPA: gliding motility-associated C-terminal domain-containing protein, partial [Saprospiraceae bacterium]|nr:gliding motility-associated C-terminal domain-containing protein [Saprospiraceae bacterium]